VKPDLLRTFRLLMAPIKTRVLLMISRAIVRIVMDDKKMQQVQITVLQDEVLDNVERFQNFGFTSNPLTGAEAVLACVGGDRSHPIVIVVDDRRHRKLNLQPGEAAIYNAFGDYALLKADGTFEVVASTKVMITSPLVEMSANLKVDGNLQVLGTSVQTGLVTATAGVKAVGGVSSSGNPTAGQISDAAGDLAEIRTTYNSHHHPQSGGGNTDVPTEQMS
jgi:phage baseplate assembly protein V